MPRAITHRNTRQCKVCKGRVILVINQRCRKCCYGTTVGGFRVGRFTGRNRVIIHHGRIVAQKPGTNTVSTRARAPAQLTPGMSRLLTGVDCRPRKHYRCPPLAPIAKLARDYGEALRQALTTPQASNLAPHPAPRAEHVDLLPQHTGTHFADPAVVIAADDFGEMLQPHPHLDDGLPVHIDIGVDGLGGWDLHDCDAKGSTTSHARYNNLRLPPSTSHTHAETAHQQS